MAEPSWTEHILAGAAWRRFGMMLLFAPVLGCLGFLVFFVALFQFFAVLASGETNPHLAGLGHDVARFAAAIMEYLSYNAERPPFPFAPRASDARIRRRPRSTAASIERKTSKSTRRKRTTAKRSTKRETSARGRTIRSAPRKRSSATEPRGQQAPPVSAPAEPLQKRGDEEPTDSTDRPESKSDNE